MKSKLWPKPGSKPQPSNETVPPFPKDWTGSLIDKVASHTGVISDCSFAKEKYGDGLTYPTIDELQESASYWWHADRIQVYGEPLLVSVFATQDSKRGLSEKETQRERERKHRMSILSHSVCFCPTGLHTKVTCKWPKIAPASLPLSWLLLRRQAINPKQERPTRHPDTRRKFSL